MFTIEKLALYKHNYEQVIQSIATIEALVQPQDVWSYQTLIEMLAQESIYILVVYKQEDKADHNTVVGYCLYQVLFEKAEILRIGTHPDYQRQGIASQIFVDLNTELINNQVTSLLLEVRADNKPAIALYEQQGFKLIHCRSGYYQQPYQPAVDALIMQVLYEKDASRD